MTLTSAQSTFYTTTAVVIPVLVVAYMVEMATFARQASERINRVAADLRSRALQEIEETPDPEIAQALTDVDIGSYLTTTWPREVTNMLLLVLLVLGVVFPMIGELSAFIALSGDHASHTIFVFTWFGLGAAMLMVLLPVWRALALYRPSHIWRYRRVNRTLRKVRRLRRRQAKRARNDEHALQRVRATPETSTPARAESPTADCRNDRPEGAR